VQEITLLGRDDGGPWLDVDGASRVDGDGACDGRWQVFCFFFLMACPSLRCLRLCHGGDGLDASQPLSPMRRGIIKALPEGPAPFVHNVPLGQTADALEDVLPIEEAELQVAQTPAVGGSEDLVRVDVDDATFLGVGPPQAEGEGVVGAGMVADDDLMLSNGHRGKRYGFLGSSMGVVV